jgi:hypothetical protein
MELKIANVDLKRDGSGFILDVTAIANSRPWTNVKLEKTHHIAPPEDGIQEFTLVGDPPRGIELPAVQSFDLTEQITDTWLRGVVIKNATGGNTRRLLMATKNQPAIGDTYCSVSHAVVAGDKLLMQVTYGGGCARHDFQLDWNGVIRESFPPGVTLTLTHNGHNDPCKALLTEELEFDLSVVEGLPQERMIITLLAPDGVHEVAYDGTQPEAAAKHTKAARGIAPAVQRGYSNAYDLREAINDAVRHLPDMSGGTADYLASFTVIKIGAEKGGIAGFDRLYVDVQARP